MKILLMTTDLYRIIGGGQTIYKTIIESTPDVEFTYFREFEDEDTLRPLNAKTVPLAAPQDIRVLAPPPFPAFRGDILKDASRYIRSIAGMSFDVVDVPDFYFFGGALRKVFEEYNVTVGRIALAMHGNISISMDMGWGSDGDNVLEKNIAETEQFAAADGIYAISRRYIKKWQGIVDRPVVYIDPLHFIEARPRVATGSGKPDLYCIGRMERRKGNDLFVELLRWLNPDLYGKAAHIGDKAYALSGAGSDEILGSIARARGIDVEIKEPYNRENLTRLFGSRAIVVLPVRYDTLNLVALEAVFSGCPLVLSSEAGACDYFDENFPGLPYIKIDFGNFYGAVAPLENLLEDYDAYRAKLVAYLEQHKPASLAKLDMKAVYEDILRAPLAAPVQAYNDVTFAERSQSLLSFCKHAAHKFLPYEVRAALRAFVHMPGDFIYKRIARSRYIAPLRMLKSIYFATRVQERLTYVAEFGETSKERLREKLQAIYKSVLNPFCRCNFWLDIARIERLRGNDVMATAYELRILRLLGEDRHGLLPQIVKTLKANDYPYEAEAAQIMYGDPKHAEEKTYQFLKRAFQHNLAKQEKTPLAKIDDRRQGTPKVSVIVSLYNAAPKLNLFLTCLARQTLVQKGLVEIILVDSNSPVPEYETFLSFIAKQPLNIMYVRSAERETIQAAWNRGIGLARAPYLVFLGADETLYPEALETLAQALDGDAGIDWVMADSLVTDVDERGILKKDVMIYDRTGGIKDHTYLETCYLSWVGGMYRKTVHDRFGMYDESFRAAGDTEFKNRLMPTINVKYIPKTLGLFLNYPDERMTASPRAEIEDLRAWYIHRTPGGIRYGFENRSNDEIERLFYLAVGYRKSFCTHTSSDLDYAIYLAEALEARRAPGGWAETATELRGLVEEIRKLEYTEAPTGSIRNIVLLVRSWLRFRAMQTRHRQRWQGKARPAYKIFNDNRYEQHSWLWKSS